MLFPRQVLSGKFILVNGIPSSDRTEKSVCCAKLDDVLLSSLFAASATMKKEVNSSAELPESFCSSPANFATRGLVLLSNCKRAMMIVDLSSWYINETKSGAKRMRLTNESQTHST
jgi:hypothetical protein